MESTDPHHDQQQHQNGSESYTASASAAPVYSEHVDHQSHPQHHDNADDEEQHHHAADHQHQSHNTYGHHHAAFSTPVRSSHAEAQAALEAVAAAASAGKIQMTPPSSSTDTSFLTTPAAAAAAAAAAASASASASSPSSPGPSASPFGTHLGRNKACQSCRARKLKCDGQKPVCGQCAKGWQIKFRMAQNKAKNKKKAQDPAVQAELESLPEYMPPCVYLPVTQRTSSRSARPSATGLESGDVSMEAPSATATPISATKKRKRTEDQSDDQVVRMQHEIDQLKRQLAQVTGVVDDQSTHLATAFANHHQQQQQQQQQGADGAARHPSKDELAIAHMLATSMPSGEGPATSQGMTASGAPFDYQQHAAAAVAAAAANGLDGNSFGVLDPALHDSTAVTASEQAHQLSVASSGNGYPQAHAANARMTVSDAAHKQAKVSELHEEMHEDLASPLLELMMSSWPADFPPPNLVTQLVTTYFEKTTAQSLFIHPAKFMENLSQGPQHPRFPSRGVLHGIFAHAYPRLRTSEMPAGSFGGHPHPSVLGSGAAEKRQSMKAAAAFHAKRAQGLVQKACAEGSFEEAAQIQSLLVAYHYINDQSFEAWMVSGGFASLVKGMELNRLAPIRSYGSQVDERKAGTSRGPKAGIYRAAIKRNALTALEHEERIRLFWNCYYSDRAACSSTHWAQNIDDLDIRTELPGAFDDFINASPDLVYRERQTLDSPNLFTELHYDPALLHLKAAILHARCVNYMSRLPHDAGIVDVLSTDFHKLDATITAMMESVPAKWRDLPSFDPMLQPTGDFDPPYLNDGVNYRPSKQISLMTNQLVLAHGLLYGSAISLHEPVAHHVDQSARKSSRAAQRIIGIIKVFVAARVDLLQAGSLLTLMIVLAARALVRQYKKTRKEATKAYQKLRRANADSGGAGGGGRLGASSTTSSPPTFNRKEAGTSYNKFGMGLDAPGSGDGEQPTHLNTAGITESLEDEMETALEHDPTLRSQVDPEGLLASLRDDLELIFWSLVKYGETYPLGVGQAKVVAQLLGKDYSSELEQSGLFKKVAGGASTAGSVGSDVGSFNEQLPPNASGSVHPGMQAPAQPHQAYHQQQHPYHQPNQTAWNPNAAFHPAEASYRIGSLYMERPPVSAYYPAQTTQHPPK
ncbi:hypothetical protein BCV70DRAFT_196960 [Testicularia cyperi]|uniref:Zn(2)-C6 fungal-type domain-containing protein n=1 Tax=Testicularia cyperi TaxID=1882483 RepID=A0A317XX80_9BASI|nr:hypothetical protein BCV70DRAFT_196960 [Testicularia cyperi]